MSIPYSPLNEAAGKASSTRPAPSSWSMQRVAQRAWIVVAIGLAALFVANLPFYYQSSQILCTQPASGCPTGQLPSVYVHLLAQFPVPVTTVAVLFDSITLAVSLAYWAVGLLLFWRKSQEWMGLYASLLFIMLGAIDIFGYPAAQAPQLIQFLTQTVVVAVSLAGTVFFFTFPTGRFTPRWTLGLCAVVLAGTLPFLPSIVNLLTLPLVVMAQVYRYIRVYDPVQRQQAKWFVFGFGVGVVCLALYYLLGAIVPGWGAPDSWYQLLNPFTWLLLWTLLLLTITIAILRYRLWDIDALINKALVYGSLTALLVSIYVGTVLAAQALLLVITGSLDQQPLVIVGATLVIAALLQPLRRRLQSSVDYRFYRRAYDAARVLATFGDVLRHEVELEQLQGHVLAAVQETMQPTHVSLWLRQTSEKETPSLVGGALSQETSGASSSPGQETSAS